MLHQVQDSLQSSHIFEYRATKVWRQLKDKGVVEKGGGRDGDYRFTNIKIVVPDDESGVPFINATYGTTMTINAAVNDIHARYHMQGDKRTVVLLIKNHAGWTKGMTRVHFIRFKDEVEAEDFVATYNSLSDKMSKRAEEEKKFPTNHHSRLVDDKSIVDAEGDEFVGAGEEEAKVDEKNDDDEEYMLGEMEGEKACGTQENKEDVDEEEGDLGRKGDNYDVGETEDELEDSHVSDYSKNHKEGSAEGGDDDGSIDLLFKEANTQDWPHVFDLKISDD